MLQNELEIDQMPPWWCCVMDKNLRVLLSLEETTNSDHIPNSICSNTVSNLQETSTLLYCCLQTLILAGLSSVVLC